MEIFHKKKLLRILLTIYTISYILNSLFFANSKNIYAEENIQNTNLVAVIVDSKIYENQKNNIQRYATSYIQQKISDSKAIVLPINTNNFQAPDIVKMLENIYFDGIQNEPSKLVGLVLIGDIPLPVVENNNFIYPSIFPYVDFENQQFVYNADNGFFTYNNNPNGQAELRHGIIKYDKSDQYSKFFDKLKTYDADPSKFVASKIWYDDFVATKQNFLADNITYYVNNSLFTEDIGYRRFTDLMLGILKGEHNNVINEATSGFTNSITQLDGSSDPEEQSAADYGKTIQKLMDEFNKIMKDIDSSSEDDISSSTDTSSAPQPLNTPTLSLKKLTQEFLKSYDTLLSTKYLTRMRDNVKAPARRYQPNQSGDLVESFD